MALENLKERAREKIGKVIGSVKESAKGLTQISLIIGAASGAMAVVLHPVNANANTLDEDFAKYSIPHSLARSLNCDNRERAITRCGGNRFSPRYYYPLNDKHRLKLGGGGSIREFRRIKIGDDLKLQNTGEVYVYCNGDEECSALKNTPDDPGYFETESGNRYIPTSTYIGQRRVPLLLQNNEPFIIGDGTCDSSCIRIYPTEIRPFVPGEYLSSGACLISERQPEVIHSPMTVAEFNRITTCLSEINNNLNGGGCEVEIAATKRHIFAVKSLCDNVADDQFSVFDHDFQTGRINPESMRPLPSSINKFGSKSLVGVYENHDGECLFFAQELRGDNPLVTCHLFDDDQDGLWNREDNCPDTPNNPRGLRSPLPAPFKRSPVIQPDRDLDTMGDACDPCPLDQYNDGDGDSFCGDVDNCKEVFNPDQLDTDLDGLGDICDSQPAFNPANDLDKDGIPIPQDNCPGISNRDQRDDDSDGKGNRCDPCINDARDQCPLAIKLRNLPQGQRGLRVIVDDTKESSGNEAQGCSCETTGSADSVIPLLLLGFAEMVRRRLRQRG